MKPSAPSDSDDEEAIEAHRSIHPIAESRQRTWQTHSVFHWFHIFGIWLRRVNKLYVASERLYQLATRRGGTPKEKVQAEKRGDAQKKLAKSTKTKFEDPDEISQEVSCSLSPSADNGNGESGIEEEEDTDTISEPTSVIDGRRMMEDRMKKNPMPTRTRATIIKNMESIVDGKSAALDNKREQAIPTIPP
jgi:hypothetical protein